METGMKYAILIGAVAIYVLTRKKSQLEGYGVASKEKKVKLNSVDVTVEIQLIKDHGTVEYFVYADDWETDGVIKKTKHYSYRGYILEPNEVPNSEQYDEAWEELEEKVIDFAIESKMKR